jgi:hypothetical protein
MGGGSEDGEDVDVLRVLCHEVGEQRRHQAPLLRPALRRLHPHQQVLSARAKRPMLSGPTGAGAGAGAGVNGSKGAGAEGGGARVHGRGRA